MLSRGILVAMVIFGGVNGQIKHNLPPGVELVDPKSLGFDESQLDLSSLLGNVKLLPINSNTDPKTGLKTQVLTVGFDGKDEDFNLDDFELPGQQGGNNSELVMNAFQSFKDYFKKGQQNVQQNVAQQPQQQVQVIQQQPQQVVQQPVAQQQVVQQPQVIQQQPKPVRRRKIVPKKPPPPKIVELESDQIEKLLATGKLKSKKIGDSQVIEITQDQLNELYGGSNGGEFRELLGGSQSVGELVQEQPRQQQVVQQQIQQQHVQQQQVVQEPQPQQPQPQQQIVQQPKTPQQPKTVQQQPTQQPQPIQIYQETTTTQPPIIYSFNTNDYQQQQQQQQQQQVYRQYQQPQQQVAQPRPQEPRQISKHIKTPTFEFISVPPVSFSTQAKPQQPTQPVAQQQQQQYKFTQDPLPVTTTSKGRIYFPVSGRFHRHLTPEQLNTFYEDDGLNYKDSGKKSEAEELRGV